MSDLRVIPEVMIIVKNGMFTEFLQTLESFVSLENTERKSRINISMYSLVKTTYAYVSKNWRKVRSKVKFWMFQMFLSLLISCIFQVVNFLLYILVFDYYVLPALEISDLQF